MDADPRMAAWTKRAHEIDRLKLLKGYRAGVCGCTRCLDADRLDELAVRIRRSDLAIEELTNLCCQRVMAMHQPI